MCNESIPISRRPHLSSGNQVCSRGFYFSHSLLPLFPHSLVVVLLCVLTHSHSRCLTMVRPEVLVVPGPCQTPGQGNLPDKVRVWHSFPLLRCRRSTPGASYRDSAVCNSVTDAVCFSEGHKNRKLGRGVFHFFLSCSIIFLPALSLHRHDVW